MKKIILGLVLIIVIVISYMNYNSNINEEVKEHNEDKLIKQSDDYFLSIYNNNEKIKYGDKGPDPSAPEPQIEIVAKGDINSDDLEDAVISVLTCGASCSLNYHYLLQNNDSEPAPLLTGDRYNSLYMSSSALRTSVTDIKIDDGKVIMTGYYWAGWEEREKNIDDLETYEFTIKDGVLN
jgi:hypothetical protein